MAVLPLLLSLLLRVLQSQHRRLPHAQNGAVREAARRWQRPRRPRACAPLIARASCRSAAAVAAAASCRAVAAVAGVVVACQEEVGLKRRHTPEVLAAAAALAAATAATEPVAGCRSVAALEQPM